MITSTRRRTRVLLLPLMVGITVGCASAEVDEAPPPAATASSPTETAMSMEDACAEVIPHLVDAYQALHDLGTGTGTYTSVREAGDALTDTLDQAPAELVRTLDPMLDAMSMSTAARLTEDDELALYSVGNRVIGQCGQEASDALIPFPPLVTPAPPEPLPAYQIVDDPTRPDAVIIEVSQLLTQEQAVRILEEVRATKYSLPDDGYHALINCSTGGTPSADNRLANGKFAIGALGQARTGLPPGQIEVTLNDGRQCPA